MEVRRLGTVTLCYSPGGLRRGQQYGYRSCVPVRERITFAVAVALKIQKASRLRQGRIERTPPLWVL